MKTESLLSYYIQLWNLTEDGVEHLTHSSILQPVIYMSKRAMLKISLTEEEKNGSKLMVWWDGLGAVKVFEHDENAILMERISGTDNLSLTTMAITNRDNEASQIICKVAGLLHECHKKPLPQLVPLEIWFNDLFLFADRYGEVLMKCSSIARSLINNQQDIAILHGDLHHGNVLYSSDKGWLAIDPKGLIGDRAFDYVNILCNPNAEIALKKGRLASQINVISNESKISFDYLLQWTIAWCGLSAVWFLNDGAKTCTALDVAKVALDELRK